MSAPASALTVVARWKVPQAALGEVLAHVAALREASLAEPGCLGYEAFQAHSTPGTVLLLEHYRDDAALQAHRESAHYRALVVERILPRLSSRQVEILRAHVPA
jgi:quinol monooxygenase YgiN